MTTTTSEQRELGKLTLYSAGLALIWLVLASLDPTTTYHLAPLLVAGAPPALAWLDRGASNTTSLLLAGLGAAMAGLATLILSLTGRLLGPSLLPTGGAALEGVVFAVIGAVMGLVIAVLGRRRSTETQ